MQKLVSALVLGIGFATAQAGTRTNSGGDALVCYKDAAHVEIESATLFDFYEHDTSVRLSDPNLIPEQKVLYAIERLERLDPTRANSYREFLATFASEIRWLKRGEKLPEVDDMGYAVIADDDGNVVAPDDCKIIQIAVQRQQPFDSAKRYFIREDLWLQFNNDQRAGLMLHEIIYREALQRGHIDSAATRYFTSLLASDALATMSKEDYDQRLIDFGLVGYFYYTKNLRNEDYVHWYIRGKAPYDLAESMCAQLPSRFGGGWHLLQISDATLDLAAKRLDSPSARSIGWQRSAIGRALLAAAGNQPVQIWLSNSNAVPVSPIRATYFMHRNWMEMNREAPLPVETPLPFICAMRIVK